MSSTEREPSRRDPIKRTAEICHVELADPLRPYYVAPAIEDSIFSPALSAGPKNGSSRASPAITNNRYARVDELLDLDSGEPASVEGLVKGFLSTSLLGFASTAIVQPFEVGKVLLQVQWIPKEAASNIAELDDVGGLDESRDFSSDVGEVSSFQSDRARAKSCLALGRGRSGSLLCRRYISHDFIIYTATTGCTKTARRIGVPAKEIYL